MSKDNEFNLDDILDEFRDLDEIQTQTEDSAGDLDAADFDAPEPAPVARPQKPEPAPAAEPPKPTPQPEPAKPQPVNSAPAVEPPKPAPVAEPPKPAPVPPSPKPAPVVEPPKPAPEPPKPAPPIVEQPKPVAENIDVKEIDFSEIERLSQNQFIDPEEELSIPENITPGEEAEQAERELEEWIKPKKRPKEKKEREPREPKEPRPPVDVSFNTPLMRKTAAMRLTLLFLFGAAAAYITLAPTYGFPMPEFLMYTKFPFYTIFGLTALHAISLILSLDVIVPGLLSIFDLRPNKLAPVALANLASLAYAVTIIVYPEWGGLLPYNAVGIFSLFFCLVGVNSQAKAEARVKKVCKGEYTQSYLYYDPQLDIIRKENSETDIVSRVDISYKSKFENIYSWVVLGLGLILPAAAYFLRNSQISFFWAFSATTTVGASFSSVCSHVLPMSFATKRLASVGAALTRREDAGLLDSRFASVSDFDLYPVKSITLKGLKVYGDHSLEKVLAYTASAVNQNQSSIGNVFITMLKSQFGNLVEVGEVLHHESGGMSCKIHGDQVLVGTCGFMLMRGVDVRHGKNLKNGVFVAINSQLAGVFAFIYEPQPEVRRALVKLIKNKVTPVITSLDFNIHQSAVELRFKLKVDTTDYPDLDARMDILNSNCEELPPAGIMTIDDIGVYTSLILAAKRVKRATRFNNILAAISTLGGMAVMFALLYADSYISSVPRNMLLYMFLWFIPVYFMSKRSSDI